ncbi:serine hydrolase domain-containing protein [Paenibacillus guangzhouensis]|uniref:serine hydrolase domain-containing protein n=1 Tax=Paenibacillus guangzhouensis TaxID=1473112 RepID=UPI0012675C4F|nr:serine hydrolase [Paenibacillus guangzhouensis]
MSPFDLDAIERSITTHALRSCILARGEQILFEYYREPESADALSKVNSCTKSVLSALVGIAIDQGILPGTDAKIHTFFPQLAHDADQRKRDITIEHLLDMTAGFEWMEFGGLNSFPRMTKTANWIDFTLTLPLADPPGTRMIYNSGCSQLLAAMVMQAAGQSVEDFAQQHLFHPLGIETWQWEVDPQGIHTGGFGLYLKPRDMLKFGQLYLHRGRHQGKQLLSDAWIEQSTLPRVQVSKPREGMYGWHWWVSSFTTEQEPSIGVPYYFALGFGGQYIIVVPSHDLVAVLTNDRHKKRKPPIDVFLQYIASTLVRGT